MDDCIHLSMDTLAQFVAFSARYVCFFSWTVAYVTAVYLSTRRASVAGGDYLVVSDDDSSVVSAEASSSFENDRC
jgi:hypothetical protein